MSRLDDNMDKLTEFDVAPFETDNKRYARRGKRVPLATRSKMIDDHFPSVKKLDWNDILTVDEEGLPEGIFAWILRDIFKYDHAEPGKDGPRFELTHEQELASIRRAFGDDYSERPFAEAFAILARDDSFAVVARKTFISKTRVFRLLNGQEPPDVEDMRGIAKAYGKDPSYFHEFRVEFVLSAITKQLAHDPDQAIVVFRRLVRAT